MLVRRRHRKKRLFLQSHCRHGDSGVVDLHTIPIAINSLLSLLLERSGPRSGLGKSGKRTNALRSRLDQFSNLSLGLYETAAPDHLRRLRRLCPIRLRVMSLRLLIAGVATGVDRHDPTMNSTSVPPGGRAIETY